MMSIDWVLGEAQLKPAIRVGITSFQLIMVNYKYQPGLV